MFVGRVQINARLLHVSDLMSLNTLTRGLNVKRKRYYKNGMIFSVSFVRVINK